MDADFESLIESAKEMGATKAVSFDAKKVAVDERVRVKCCIPICDDYGINLMCPPNVMGVNEFRTILSKYEYAILVQIESPIPAEMKKEIEKGDDLSTLFGTEGFPELYGKSFNPNKLKLHRIVNKVEAKAFSMGYRFSAGFIAGSCRLCARCVTVDSDKPCRHPFMARPSMEAMGIDVFQTAMNAGLPFDIPPKKSVILNGLVLIA